MLLNAFYFELKIIVKLFLSKKGVTALEIRIFVDVLTHRTNIINTRGSPGEG